MSVVTDQSLFGRRWAIGLTNSALLTTFLTALVATLIMSAPNLVDPMIRWDDYPALFGDGTLFWSKTLHEGRWLNYIWHLREWLAPAWLNFAIYQVSWAAFAAGLATVAFRRQEDALYRGLLAVAIVAAPSAMFISLWFNTLIPGLALVALYAVWANFASARAVTIALPFFVIATFMAYTTYPLLLLAVCLLRQDRRSAVRLVCLLALFTLSIIAAVLITYTLNYYVHGVFGVPLDEWRAATPAEGWQGYLDNLDRLKAAGSSIVTALSFDFLPLLFFHCLAMIAAVTALLRHGPILALYIFGGLFTGISMVAAQVLQTGAEVPMRAFAFFWVFHWIGITFAILTFPDVPSAVARLAGKVALLLVGFHLVLNVQHYAKFRAWQGETRTIASLVSGKGGPLYVVGAPMHSLPGLAANIQSNYAFKFRMQQLTGQTVVLCAETPTQCPQDVRALSASDDINVVTLPEGRGNAIIYKDQTLDA